MSRQRTALGAALLAAALFGAGWQIQGWRMDAKIAALHTQHAAALADAQAAARAIETRRMEEIEHVRATAQTRIDTLRGDADRAGAAAERLRRELAAARARGTASDTTAADRGPRQPDTTTVDMLTGLLERMEQEAQSMAGYADELRIAGLACEASYEAVRVTEATSLTQ